jgi:hypothetical protein
MHPKVDPLLRRAALATLFRSPQFQSMDGLDVYIGDYSNPAPLAPAVAAGLRHARALLARDDAAEKDGQGVRATAGPSTPAASHGQQPAPAAPAASGSGSATAGAGDGPAGTGRDDSEQS